MKRVGIIDYGMGNLDSVARAIEECGGRPVVTSREDDLVSASLLVLPGVGSFGTGARALQERSLDAVIIEQVQKRGVPILGLCLGMQLLAGAGTEGGDGRGLGLIDGRVARMVPANPSERIPHVGWNEVTLERPSPLFNGMDGKDFYFVHSFHVICEDEADVVGRTPYCGGFVSAIARDHVMGVQFHPEKSQRAGFRLLENFLAM